MDLITQQNGLNRSKVLEKPTVARLIEKLYYLGSKGSL